MGLFGKSKSQLLQWQNLVIENSPSKLVTNEKQLEQISYSKAQNYMKIIKDSSRIICETADPETFFSRYELLLKRSYDLVQLSYYIKFQGMNPQFFYQQVQTKKQDEIKNMFVRCWDNTISKAEKLKTPSAKKNRYTKLYETLEKYDSEMNDDNKAYYKNRYNDLISEIEKVSK